MKPFKEVMKINDTNELITEIAERIDYTRMRFPQCDPSETKRQYFKEVAEIKVKCLGQCGMTEDEYSKEFCSRFEGNGKLK